MTPYYKDDHVTIYHADAREIDQEIIKQAEVCIMDPVWPNASVPLQGQEDPFGLLEAILARTYGSHKRLAIHVGCDSDPRFSDAVPPIYPFFRHCWLDYAVPSHKGRLLYTGDVAWMFGQPPKSRGRGTGSMIIPGRCTSKNAQEFTPWRTGHVKPKSKYMGGRNSLHPCPRKLEHVSWLVSWWSQPDETIIDYCAGSMTTGLAAKGHNRKCICIEIEEEFCERGAKRLEQGIML